jgi:hypothetical protein
MATVLPMAHDPQRVQRSCHTQSHATESLPNVRTPAGQSRQVHDEHFHRYRLIEARHCDVPLEILISAGKRVDISLDSE